MRYPIVDKVILIVSKVDKAMGKTMRIVVPKAHAKLQ